MGALSDAVKHAEAAATEEWFDELMPKAAEPNALAVADTKDKAIADLTQLLDQMKTTKPQAAIQRLRKIMPTSNEEAWQRGVKWTGALGGVGLAVGALSSLLGHREQERSRLHFMNLLRQDPTMPNREMRVPLQRPRKSASEEHVPMEKQGWPYLLAGGLAAPFLMKTMGVPGVGEMFDRAKKYTSESFTSTEDPTTRPWVLPAFFLAATAGTYGGKQIFDKVFKRMRDKRKEREKHWAEREFQASLQEQYSEAGRAGKRGVKYSSLGGAVSILAQAHVNGELAAQLSSMEKKADPADLDPNTPRPKHTGQGMQGLGIYLLIASMLGVGGFAGMRSLMSSRDTERKKQNAMSRALKRRTLASPPQFIVDRGFGDEAEDEDEEELDF